VLGRLSDEDLTYLFTGYGYKPYFVEGHEPERMHQLMAATLDSVIEEIQGIQKIARSQSSARRRVADDYSAQPKGVDRSKFVDGKPIEGRGAPISSSHRFGNETGTPEDSRRLDEELPA